MINEVLFVTDVAVNGKITVSALKDNGNSEHENIPGTNITRHEAEINLSDWPDVEDYKTDKYDSYNCIIAEINSTKKEEAKNHINSLTGLTWTSQMYRVPY